MADLVNDPALRSFIDVDADSPFPIQNLPFCTFVHPLDLPTGADWSFGLAIGDYLLDLKECHDRKLLADLHEWNGAHFSLAVLRDASLPSKLRRYGQRLLGTGGNLAEKAKSHAGEILVPIRNARFLLPLARTPNYTDFYASIHHATNVGSMFRPDNALLPNYKHIPIGYHGRASSIVPSGAPIRRPAGQTEPMEPGARPGFGPCKMLDYELELGAVIGRGNELGEPIPIGEAEDHIFGMCIVNDWSARDMQKWEYQPLGPFLAKNFATSVSPCIVTMEALAPFRTSAFERAPDDPRPLPYLDSDHNRSRGGIDITCEVFLASAEMRKRGLSPVRLSKGSFRHMYWTLAQLVAHHTSNGCNLQPGDLLASGTISGPTRDSRGCLLELTWDGDPWASPPNIVPGSQRTPIKLPTGEERKFLADGDEVVMRAWCERDGFRRIGFGECRGVIEPARS